MLARQESGGTVERQKKSGPRKGRNKIQLNAGSGLFAALPKLHLLHLLATLAAKGFGNK